MQPAGYGQGHHHRQLGLEALETVAGISVHAPGQTPEFRLFGTGRPGRASPVLATTAGATAPAALLEARRCGPAAAPGPGCPPAGRLELYAPCALLPWPSPARAPGPGAADQGGAEFPAAHSDRGGGMGGRPLVA